MSRQQPVGQVRLTNIAVVRYKTKGLRFEIACFPNKVLDYRKKVEKDLYNVIQSDSIFSNVGKGQFARRDDVMAAFGTLDIKTIITTILEKGQMQVTEKERQAEISAKTKEIITIVTGMCINSETKQPISSRVIEQALKDSAFQINLQIPVKSQAMKVFRLLSQTLPIERVKMKIQISSPASYTNAIKHLMTVYNGEEKNYNIIVAKISRTTHSVEFTLVIDPGYLREITDDINVKTNGQGDVSVVDMQVERDDLLEATDNQLDGDDMNEMLQDNNPEKATTSLAIAQINNVNENYEAKPVKKQQKQQQQPEDFELDDQNTQNADVGVIIRPIIQRGPLSRPPVTKPTRQAPPQQQQQPVAVSKINYGNEESDDDDDILAILNRSDKVKVIREEDEPADADQATIVTPGQAGIQFYQKPTKQTTQKKQRVKKAPRYNPLSEYVDMPEEESEYEDEDEYDYEDEDEDDEEEYRTELKNQFLKTKTVNFASAVDATGLDDEEYNGMQYDEYDDEDLDYFQQQQNVKNVELSKNAQTELNTTKSMFSHYLITNPPILDKTATTNANNTSAVNQRKQQYVSKYDKRRTLYTDFMYIFNNDDEFSRLPQFKQDLDSLEQIKRQTMLQAINDEYTLEFEEYAVGAQ